MDTIYDEFSLFFREIITATGRMRKEEMLMEELTHKINIQKDEPILDAACGTGEALHYLKYIGYRDIEGLDLSKNMIQRAKEKLPDITFHHCGWEQLDNGSFTKKYKLVFIIGVSLLHAKVEDLPAIVENIYYLLLTKGVFVLDVRRWGGNDLHGVIQKNRPIGCYKKVCEFELGEYKYLVEDKCTYTQNRQHIRYRVNCSDETQKDVFYDVSYARLSVEYFQNLLKETGFRKIEVREEYYWPYILILAQK